MTILWASITVAGALTIALYATWLLVERLRKGEPKAKTFGEWLKHLFEAIWGL